MSQTYRALLVGTGSVADSHVSAIAATTGRVQLVGAVEVDAARLAAFATRHGIGAAHTDYAAALQSLRPDLVLIAAPPSLHADMTVAALEAGASVLCEKPFCASLAELDRIEAAERRTGKFAACIFQQRFGSSTAHVRRLAAGGLLGRPLVAVCHTLWFRDAGYYAVPWRGKWATEFGGPTMGLGIHAMDHLLHLLGDWAEIRANAAVRPPRHGLNPASAPTASGNASRRYSAKSSRPENIVRIAALILARSGSGGTAHCSTAPRPKPVPTSSSTQTAGYTPRTFCSADSLFSRSSYVEGRPTPVPLIQMPPPPNRAKISSPAAPGYSLPPNGQPRDATSGLRRPEE